MVYGQGMHMAITFAVTRILLYSWSWIFFPFSNNFFYKAWKYIVSNKKAAYNTIKVQEFLPGVYVEIVIYIVITKIEKKHGYTNIILNFIFIQVFNMTYV